MLTSFEDIYKEATREEQKELLRLHVNQVVWKPQELCLELFNDPTDRLTTPGLVQSDVLSGSGGRTRTYDTVVNSHLLCRLSYAGSRFNSQKNLRQGPISVKGEDRISYLVSREAYLVGYASSSERRSREWHGNSVKLRNWQDDEPGVTYFVDTRLRFLYR